MAKNRIIIEFDDNHYLIEAKVQHELIEKGFMFWKTRIYFYEITRLKDYLDLIFKEKLKNKIKK